jgi:predicted ribosomally synthesized peptide with SipW-like signal peptide
MADNNTNIKLSRRKILAGLGTIGLASAGAGAGTMALFSDSENARAEVRAGTLDLTVNGENGVVTILDEEGIAPGDSGEEPVAVKNAGSIAGMLTASIDSVEDYENGRNDAERGDGDDDSEGELSEHLKVALKYGNYTSPWKTLADVNERTYGPWEFGAGVRQTVTIMWHLPVTAGNVVQSDRVTADMTLSLTQKANTVTGSTDTGFPSTAVNNDFNAAFRYGDNGGAAEQEIQIRTGAGSAGDAHYEWDENEHSFELDYDRSNDELTISIDGDVVASESGLDEADEALSVTVNSAAADDGGVAVSDLVLDGKQILPGAVSASNGEGKKHVEVTGQDFSSGFTLEGTFQFTFGASPATQSPAIYFDFN